MLVKPLSRGIERRFDTANGVLKRSSMAFKRTPPRRIRHMGDQTKLLPFRRMAIVAKNGFNIQEIKPEGFITNFATFQHELEQFQTICIFQQDCLPILRQILKVPYFHRLAGIIQFAQSRFQDSDIVPVPVLDSCPVDANRYRCGQHRAKQRTCKTKPSCRINVSQSCMIDNEQADYDKPSQSPSNSLCKAVFPFSHRSFAIPQLSPILVVD